MKFWIFTHQQLVPYHIMKSWACSALCTLNSYILVWSLLKASFSPHYLNSPLCNCQEHREWGKFMFPVFQIFPTSSWLRLYIDKNLGDPIISGLPAKQLNLTSSFGVSIKNLTQCWKEYHMLHWMPYVVSQLRENLEAQEKSKFPNLYDFDYNI